MSQPAYRRHDIFDMVWSLLEPHLLGRAGIWGGKARDNLCTPPGTSLGTMVQVAGSRWTVEECFTAAKGEIGLDHYEVCSWQGGYRHMTLAMAELAYLAALCAQSNATSTVKKTENG